MKKIKISEKSFLMAMIIAVVILGLGIFCFWTINNVSVRKHGLKLGPESERFFDRIEESLSKNSSKDIPMSSGEYTYPMFGGDLNNDGLVNGKDVEIFEKLKGVCRGDYNYDPRIDIDASGCIDVKDANFLFPYE